MPPKNGKQPRRSTRLAGYPASPTTRVGKLAQPKRRGKRTVIEKILLGEDKTRALNIAARTVRNQIIGMTGFNIQNAEEVPPSASTFGVPAHSPRLELTKKKRNKTVSFKPTSAQDIVVYSPVSSLGSDPSLPDAVESPAALTSIDAHVETMFNLTRQIIALLPKYASYKLSFLDEVPGGIPIPSDEDEFGLDTYYDLVWLVLAAMKEPHEARKVANGSAFGSWPPLLPSTQIAVLNKLVESITLKLMFEGDVPSYMIGRTPDENPHFLPRRQWGKATKKFSQLNWRLKGLHNRVVVLVDEITTSSQWEDEYEQFIRICQRFPTSGLSALRSMVNVQPEMDSPMPSPASPVNWYPEPAGHKAESPRLRSRRAAQTANSRNMAKDDVTEDDLDNAEDDLHDGEDDLDDAEDDLDDAEDDLDDAEDDLDDAEDDLDHAEDSAVDYDNVEPDEHL